MLRYCHFPRKFAHNLTSDDKSIPPQFSLKNAYHDKGIYWYMHLLSLLCRVVVRTLLTTTACCYVEDILDICWNVTSQHQFLFQILLIYKEYLFASNEITIPHWKYGQIEALAPLFIWQIYILNECTRITNATFWVTTVIISRFSDNLIACCLNIQCNNFTSAVIQF